MKKILNSKGMTLVEIILSIGLVSIVMVQVLNLLVDLKDEQVIGKDKTTDLTNRAIIIKTVEEDFINKTITKISHCDSNIPPKIADYVIKSCLRIEYVGEADKPRFFITARDRWDKNDFFIYGFGVSSTDKIPARNSYEAWKLTSGIYPKVATGSCGYLINTFKNSTDNAGKYTASDYFQITYPVKVKESISNTSMTFDLEFVYYYRPSGSPATVNFDTTLRNCANKETVKYD